MTTSTDRRAFLKQSLAGAAGLGLAGRLHAARSAAAEPLFKISLAQWSLHRTINGGQMDAFDFPRAAKADFGVDAVEYVNQFYKGKKGDPRAVAELKKRCDGEGVTSLLIMCDGEGNLGDPDAWRRKQVVENHRAWAEWAKELGCHSIRVNAASEGSYQEQMERAADGLRMLTELAADMGLNVLVENHGGLSSDGQWLAGVMKMVGHPRCGTLPDFGNFKVRDGEEYDRYKGVAELMPFAKAVSAKSHEFDEAGNETRTDYRKMLKIVLDAGYRGHVGIEYEGEKTPEPEGICLTKALLERVRAELGGNG